MRCNCGKRMQAVDACIAGDSLIKVFRCNNGHYRIGKYSNFPSFSSLRRAWRRW